jgi:8-oxo-dGTP pyrophosphatase MutT (NUDIX family)
MISAPYDWASMERIVTAARIRAAMAGRIAEPDPVAPEGEARPAAVLVPLLGALPEIRVVFTVRGADLSRHAGEVSFPGGLADPGESLQDAALRESEEELGIAPADVEVLGVLPQVHTHVSGILITPFVGLLHEDPELLPSEAEIAEVLEIPLQVLADVGEVRWIEREGMRFPTQVFEVGGHVIWGATGRILRSFLDLLGQIT